MSQRLLAMMLVSLAVILNLISAVLLKEAADMKYASPIYVCILIFSVIFINLLRMFFWAAIHKRFRLSDSYPLTSLFFPMILVISAFYGEEIGIAKLIGTAFITLGVLVLVAREETITDVSESSASC
jgi:uncharacterized membrane protein